MLKGSLYHYIDSKEDLLFTLIDDFHRRAIDNLDRWHAVDGDALSRMRALVYGHVLETAEHLVPASVFQHEFRALGPHRRSTINEARDRYEAALRVLIDQGRREGQVCPDVDAKLVTIALLGMVNSVYNWYRPNRGRPPDVVGMRFADVAVASLVCDPDAHTPGHRRTRGGLDPEAVAAALQEGGDALAPESAPLAPRLGPRHQQIVEGAVEVFHQKGYDRASVKDVAAEVGMLKGSLYHYIDSKEDLLFAALDQFHRSALRSLERWRSLGDAPLAKIRAVVHGHVAQIARHPARAAVFHHEFRALSPDRRAAISAARDGYERAVRQLILEGQRGGEVCPDVDAKVESLALLGMLNSVYRWYQPGGEWAPEEIGMRFADLAVASLACTPGAHADGHRHDRGRLAPEVVAAVRSKDSRA